MIECYFISSNNEISSTICGNCGKEKMLHTIGSGIKVSTYFINPQEEIELNKLKKQFQMKAAEALELNSKIGNFGKEELKQVPIENDEFCYYSGLPSPAAYKENMNPFELPNVLPDDVFKKSLEEIAEKEYPKLIVENPSCNGYNEPNHIDINEECRNAFMEGIKSDKAKDYWFDIFKKNKEKWNKVTEDTPPSNVELLVKSPNGIIHLSRWRESYNIFGCQAKSESIVGWKWKKI